MPLANMGNSQVQTYIYKYCISLLAKKGYYVTRGEQNSKLNTNQLQYTNKSLIT